MTRCSSGHIAQVIGVGLVGLTVVGCAGEPDESAQSPPEPSGVVSDRFPSLPTYVRHGARKELE